MPIPYNLLTITGVGSDNRGKVFRAYIQDEIGFVVGVHYDTIFEDVINFKGKINQLLGGVATLAELSGASLSGAVSKLEDMVFSQGLAWTRMFGGIPKHIRFDFKCTVVNFDNTEEVFGALETLYDLAVPAVSATVGRVPQMTVCVDIGGWWRFEECFLTNIQHRFSQISVQGVPLKVDLDLSFTTKYAVDRKMIATSNARVVVRTLRSEQGGTQ